MNEHPAFSSTLPGVKPGCRTHRGRALAKASPSPATRWHCAHFSPSPTRALRASLPAWPGTPRLVFFLTVLSNTDAHAHWSRLGRTGKPRAQPGYQDLVFPQRSVQPEPEERRSGSDWGCVTGCDLERELRVCGGDKTGGAGKMSQSE